MIIGEVMIMFTIVMLAIQLAKPAHQLDKILLKMNA